MNLDGHGSKEEDNPSQIPNHTQHPFIGDHPFIGRQRRRSRNPEKLALPIRALTLDRDDPYSDEELSPG
jgi:hypothetical protein